MKVELNSDLSLLDARGIAALQILVHKHKCHGDVHKAGDHFGEFCIVSRAGLRAESIKVLSGSEVYSLNRSDLWAIFQYLTYEDRRTFVFNLMTRVGGRRHVYAEMSKVSPSYAAQTDDNRLKVLYRIAFDTMSEIIDALNEEEDTDEDADEANDNNHHEPERHRDLKLLVRQKSMKASLFSQRDLIDLFEREKTVNPTIQFNESTMRSRLSSFANPEATEGRAGRFSSFSAMDRAALQREESFRNRGPSFIVPSPSTTPKTSRKVIMVSAEDLEDIESDDSSDEKEKTNKNNGREKDDEESKSDNGDETEDEDIFIAAQHDAEGSRKRSQSNNFVHNRVVRLSAREAPEDVEVREASAVGPAISPSSSSLSTAIPRTSTTNRKGSGVRFGPDVEMSLSPITSAKTAKSTELKHRSSEVDYNVVRNALEIEQIVGVGRRRGSTSIDVKDISQLSDSNCNANT